MQGYSGYSIISPSISYANSPNIDAFGRLRVSEPFTLFDSSNRYADNGQWATSVATSGTATFNTAQGLIDLNVTAVSGSEVVRETTKVFPYQPGKSLLVLSTFVMSSPKTNLRQRVGYYGPANGYYLQLNDTTVSFVERTSVSGSLVENPVAQSSWNVDKMDGTGPSGVTLDLTKAQILFMDLEWLGVGTVRIGFVVDGNFYVCHKFQHANIIASTYITTATLPLRYEITNTGATSGASTLKQICSTVLSEGGYDLRGVSRSISTPITTAITLASAGTYYPIVSIRLKAANLDGVVIPTGIAALPNSAGNYSYRLVTGGTTTGGSWVSAGASSVVDYNISGTSFTGGTTALQGFFTQSNQSSSSIELSKDDIFKFQLERNSFTSTPFEFTLLVTSNGAGDSVYGALDWQEITR
jgi:hypothetical protein